MAGAAETLVEVRSSVVIWWITTGPETVSNSSRTSAWTLNALPEARWQMWQ
ncbi:hypothetical protein [uncultured Sphingomonas sp.]|uniref:hypothetical protein n=1 Tax=unclassified Sphingomonas TaxID=196159 RepID=UPI0025E673DD|nr:hypothetical protein [uncultured Sphingomonas sp.]